jgi:DNA-binding HxlR family transcriptional regulator
LLGDYWSLRIIDALSVGEMRYCVLQRELDNVNPSTLSNKLKKLETSGLITRSAETIDKLSVSYSLTELGHQALPIIDAVNDFSLKSSVA